MSHLRRPVHDPRYPVCITLRVKPDLPDLRTPEVLAALRPALRAGRNRLGFRLVHFALRPHRVLLVCEAMSHRGLRRGVQGLAIRLARALNRLAKRHGKVFDDRYELRALRTPVEARAALRQLFLLGEDGVARGVDPYSSALEFDGWRRPVGPPPPAKETATLPPRTRLLRLGWRKAGGTLLPR